MSIDHDYCEECEAINGDSHYFRPLGKNVCEKCRKQFSHLMTVGDIWDELMIKWNRIQPWWLYRLQYYAYLVYRKGPVGAYNHRANLNKTLDRICARKDEE